MDMATAPEKVNIEYIDLVLRDAQICHVQLNFLNYMLNKPEVDERKSAEIELKCATIFRDMMSNLYSVLDQIYFFLYCHFQNKGNISYSYEAFQVKQPIKLDLKWSEDDTRDGDPECKGKRNEWVRNQCKTIFGEFNLPESNAVKNFQNNLLGLQAIRKVDKSGDEVLGPDSKPTLLRVVSIEHNARHNAEDNEHDAEDIEQNAEDIEQDAEDIEQDAEDIEQNAENIEQDAEGELLQFEPRGLEVEELKSVAETPWNDTVKFNLLHFFRNFTAHRSLIICKIKKGYFNRETRKFEPIDQNSSLPERSEPWTSLEKGSWILVPELSHLRQAERKPERKPKRKLKRKPERKPERNPESESSLVFRLLPLTTVCSYLLNFVKVQRRKLLRVLDNPKDYPYRYVVRRNLRDGWVKIENGKFTGKCRWEVAHLWPVVYDIHTNLITKSDIIHK